MIPDYYARWKKNQAEIERLLSRMETVLREIARTPAFPKRSGVEDPDAKKDS